MKKYDITALGEVLIDFTQAGVSASGMRLFEQNPGGAPANMLTAALQSGLKTAFIGKVGADMHGDFLRETLNQVGIDTKGLVRDPDSFTTLAFVSLSESGEREFSFSRKPGADTMLKIADLDTDILKNTRVLHIGSLSLTDDPARETTFEAVRIAKEAGAIISYDPNYRKPLWKTTEIAKTWMRMPIDFADVMKISDEEAGLLTPYTDPKEAAGYLLSRGVKLVCVTLGSEGVYVANANGGRIVPGFVSKVVDTTGAGDSFFGGFMSRLLQEDVKPEEASADQLNAMARFGNAVASLCVEKRGGISGIPTLDEIKERLERKS